MDVGSSVIAKNITGLCRGYAKALTVEIGITLEGRAEVGGWLLVVCDLSRPYLHAACFHNLGGTLHSHDSSRRPAQDELPEKMIGVGRFTSLDIEMHEPLFWNSTSGTEPGSPLPPQQEEE